MNLLTPQPRLRLYTKPSYYFNALLNLIKPYPDERLRNAESELIKYTGAKHAIISSMGRTAIYEGLRVLLNPGDEIIVSPLTVPEVISVIDLIGLKPVFCDVVAETWNMNPKLVEALITDKTRAVLTTHLYGLANTVDEIKTICRKHDLHFIEDAAQALSTRIDGRMAGTFGKFGIYSFSYPKNICTFYGGALVTDDDDLADKVRKNIAAYPDQDKRFYYRRVLSSLVKDIMTMPVVYPLFVSRAIRLAYAYNIGFLKKQVEVHLPVRLFEKLPDPYATRPSGLQGKIAAAKLKDVERESRHRIHAALIYDRGLQDIKEIVRPKFLDNFEHTYLYYPIEVPDKDKLMRYMISQKRDVAYQHIPNCASEDVFARYKRSCPVAQRVANSTLTLPTYGKYMLDEVEKNVAVIRSFFGKPAYRVQ